MACGPQFSELIYGAADQTGMILLLGVSLLAVIAYNYLTEMLTALRMVRVASVVQLFNAMVFALLSVGLVFGWRCDAAAIVAAYALSGVLLIGPALLLVPPHMAADSRAGRAAGPERLVGQAGAVRDVGMAMNLLYNLVSVVDRFMIIHYAPTAEPLALVGYYHSSQVVPSLMVSVGRADRRHLAAAI